MESPGVRRRREYPLVMSGITVARDQVVWLADQLHDDPAGERLRRALQLGPRTLGLSVEERDAILRALEDCPDELAELRVSLLAEQIGRQALGR